MPGSSTITPSLTAATQSPVEIDFTGGLHAGCSVLDETEGCVVDYTLNPSISVTTSSVTDAPALLNIGLVIKGEAKGGFGRRPIGVFASNPNKPFLPDDSIIRGADYRHRLDAPAIKELFAPISSPEFWGATLTVGYDDWGRNEISNFFEALGVKDAGSLLRDPSYIFSNKRPPAHNFPGPVLGLDLKVNPQFKDIIDGWTLHLLGGFTYANGRTSLGLVGVSAQQDCEPNISPIWVEGKKTDFKDGVCKTSDDPAFQGNFWGARGGLGLGKKDFLRAAAAFSFSQRNGTPDGKPLHENFITVTPALEWDQSKRLAFRLAGELNWRTHSVKPDLGQDSQRLAISGDFKSKDALRGGDKLKITGIVGLTHVRTPKEIKVEEGEVVYLGDETDVPTGPVVIDPSTIGEDPSVMNKETHSEYPDRHAIGVTGALRLQYDWSENLGFYLRGSLTYLDDDFMKASAWLPGLTFGTKISW